MVGALSPFVLLSVVLAARVLAGVYALPVVVLLLWEWHRERDRRRLPHAVTAAVMTGFFGWAVLPLHHAYQVRDEHEEGLGVAFVGRVAEGSDAPDDLWPEGGYVRSVPDSACAELRGAELGARGWARTPGDCPWCSAAMEALAGRPGSWVRSTGDEAGSRTEVLDLAGCTLHTHVVE